MMSVVDARTETFGEVLSRRAELEPDQTVFVYLRDGETDEEALTCIELHRRAQRIAGALLEKCAPGAHALLLFAPGLDYVSAVYGCFQAGVVGVSALPPQPKRLARTLPRLIAIAQDAEVDVVLTTAMLRDGARSMFTEGPLAEAAWIAVDDLPEDVPDVGVVARAMSDLAFMQYTSGSTKAPLGVMLTNENLVDNTLFIGEAFGHQPASLGFNWLPPYHDMGLIGGVLQPVFYGGGRPSVLISPLAFIKRPARWLEGVSRYRATISGGPNFAYDLCTKRVDEQTREQLDLSCWEVAFNGAEPIRPETLDAFVEMFAPCGFRRSALLTCYGLAEATLMVTGIGKSVEPRYARFDAEALQGGRAEPAHERGRAMQLVSCGAANDRHDLAIVDPETTRRCEPGRVGEIWIAGPSVARGYWHHERESEECFGRSIAGEQPQRGGYLRTGDLGVIDDGELFVVGRLKELIIVNGRNYHPHDIEFAGESAHPALRSHCSAAFGMRLGGDGRPALLLEIDGEAVEDLEEVLALVRRQVAYDIDLQLQWIGLCEPRVVPKTTSGKIQRRVCAAMLEKGEIELLAEWQQGD
jgi:acyl-CoA synthetase (AMP-forming)/AMP-acid ligase II